MTDDTQYPRVRSPHPAPRSEFAPKPSPKLSEILRRADEQEGQQIPEDIDVISEAPGDDTAAQVVNEPPASRVIVEQPQDLPPATDQAPPQGSNVGDRTARTLDNYSEMILANIDSLQGQLDNLRTFFHDDATQVRERISRFMANGQSVTNMLQTIGQQIDALQKERTELLQDHARKAT